MDHIEVECGNRRSVKHRADTAHDNEVNATPGQAISISRNLGIELGTECEQRVYLILQDSEAFARRQRQHPADQREIDSIVTVLRGHELSLLPQS